MKTRQLGNSVLSVSAIGLGCMGMSEFYGSTDATEARATLDLALDLGVSFWDTADAYGPHHNETLLGQALKGHRARVTLATKFGIVRDPANAALRGINGHPDYVRTSCEGSLRRLGVDTIDLYYLHRVDPAVPIEDTVGAMARLVEAGKVRCLGLSEVSPDTLRKAHRIHPIAALQTEYSLWQRDPEDDLFAVCRELGVGFVAYSPLGRGFLSGKIQSANDFAPDDYRRLLPRFTGDNFVKNRALVTHLEALARARRCTPSQLALAWTLAQDDLIVPIPGTKRRTYLRENAEAVNLVLSPTEQAALDAVMPRGVAAGARYAEASLRTVNQ